MSKQLAIDAFPQTTIAPENQWLQNYISFWDGRVYVSFREGNLITKSAAPSSQLILHFHFK